MNLFFKCKRYIRIFTACVSLMCLGLASYVYYNANYGARVSSVGYSEKVESNDLSANYDGEQNDYYLGVSMAYLHKEMRQKDMVNTEEIVQSKEDNSSAKPETVSETSNEGLDAKKSEGTALSLASRGNFPANKDNKGTGTYEEVKPSPALEPPKEDIKPLPEPTHPKEEPKPFPQPAPAPAPEPKPAPAPEVQLMAIMGKKQATKSQMVNYMDKYSPKDKSYCEEFVSITIEEAEAEGVRADVALCQMMKETSFLKFGGDVKEEQNNFAGLGAVGGGASGASFPDIRTGIRAVVQHLKAYGSTAPLKKTCVDPRFKYVKRGSAIYVEWLGKQENPNGYGWATDKNYGYDIVKRVNNLKNY